MRIATFLELLLLSLIGLIASTLHGQTSDSAKDAIRPPTAQDTQKSGAPSNSHAVHSRQTTFLIPFTVDSTSTVPTEVQLFVSADKGAHWQWYATSRPNEKQFRFSAKRDGEYWFTSRTVAIKDRQQPTGQLKPELSVRIDTVEPKVNLVSNAAADGQVIVDWKVADENIAPETLKIEYQTGIGQPFQTVKLDSPAIATSPGVLMGKATWRPNTEARAIDIRLEVRDLAGNRETVMKRVFLPLVVKRAGSETSPSIANTNQPPPDPYVSQKPKTSSGVVWPNDNRLPGSSTPDRSVPPPFQSQNSPASERPLAADSSNSSAKDRVSEPRDPLAGEGRYKAVPGPVRPPVAQQARMTESQGPPAGEARHMTNAKRFNLDYDLESVGPSGVKEVELWATRDGGQNWTKWGTDEDNKSPFTIESQDEGLYGFRMVVVGGTGLASTRPRPGDMADIWVGIDFTKPTARITAAIYGSGEQAGQLDIRWEASDERLSTRPVALFQAEKPDGPWQTIAAGLANNGQYYWTVPPNTTQEIFLKIEVRDEAGNVGSYQVEKAVSIEGLAPHGRIRGVRPTETSRKTTGSGTFTR